MFKSFILSLTMVSISLGIQAQKAQPYQLFTSDGKKVSYSKLLKKANNQELVLFGEEHDNAISHWLQLKLTKDCFKNRSLSLGAEMIERDNQDELDQYLNGTISFKQLDSSARLWSNYKTDYAPLVEFAKIHGLKFTGTNIPRRFASLVAKNGFEALAPLSAEEKSWIAPLPVTYDENLPGYQNMLKMMAGHGGPNLPKAQAIKDATMAHFILSNITPDKLFIHYHGTYHSEHHEGIVWYLRQKNPAIKYISIATVTQQEITKLEKEHLGKANFILCVDQDMTRTY